MNILFVTFSTLSLLRGQLRHAAILKALADAGHHVDVIAAKFELNAHANINVLAGDEASICSKRKLHLAVLKAIGRKKYDVVHAVDEAILHVATIRKVKRSKLVYDASRCFTGKNGKPPIWYWKWFPNHFNRIEQRLLRRCSLVLSFCSELTDDLHRISSNLPIEYLEDVPAQAFFHGHGDDAADSPPGFGDDSDYLVVVSMLHGNPQELKTLLLAVHQVYEKIPSAAFVVRGVDPEAAQSMAANLGISDRCEFLSRDEMNRFLGFLRRATTAIFIPRQGERYPQAEILTMLNSPGIVVAVQHEAYGALLSDMNSVRVSLTASALEEGMLRGLQEPLLSYGIVSEAQRLVRSRHSFSSFKHHVRMVYHKLESIH